MDLTYKQRLFVAAYLNESQGNATDAARRAGYKHPNVIGSRLLKQVGIKAAIAASMGELAVAPNSLLAMLSEIATGGLGKFIEVSPDGAWRIDLYKAKQAGRLGLLKKLKMTEHGTEIEVYSRLDAIDRLLQYHGLNDSKLRELTKQIDAIEKRVDAAGTKP